MDLFLFPRAIATSKPNDWPRAIPGLAHGDGQPCPFAGKGRPFGRIGSCCSFNVTELVRALGVFRGDDLASRVHRDMNFFEVARLGEQLRNVQGELEEELECEGELSVQTESSRLLGHASGAIPVWDEPLSLANAIEEVKHGVFWFGTINELRFGTSAWPNTDRDE